MEYGRVWWSMVECQPGLTGTGAVLLHTFSWNTKQERRATACSTERSLNAPLKISSVSSSSSPLYKWERKLNIISSELASSYGFSVCFIPQLIFHFLELVVEGVLSGSWGHLWNLHCMSLQSYRARVLFGGSIISSELASSYGFSVCSSNSSTPPTSWN